jgi:hypothetical protein
MGAHPYWYFVPYQQDIDGALQALRDREFKAGRYNPAMPFPELSGGMTAGGPGAQHDTIEEALEDAAEDGTRSILDIQEVADAPDFCVAAPLLPEQLEALFETDQPTHAMVESLDFIEDLERGHCVYVVVYKDGKPDELLFAGYSFD